MKFILVLFFTILITVFAGTVIKELPHQDHLGLVSPVAFSTVGSPGDYPDWQVFTNDYFHYQISYPSDISLNNGLTGDVSLLKNKVLDITITQGNLAEKDTVNTVVEKAINTKKSLAKTNFSLLKSISPIALGSVTALTYTSLENGQQIVSYYVPQTQNKYLLITNTSPDTNNDDFYTSEKIIYSLELLP